MDRRHASVLGLAAAALFAAAPAGAQTSAASYATSTSFVRKSEALLGTGSKLAQLMAQQEGQPIPTAQPAVLTTARELRSPWSDTPVRLQRPAVASERPDVFGSIALQIDATPLDHRWRAVASRPADAAATRWASSLRDRSQAERIEAVNRYVNARIAFVDDDRQFGRADVWQSAAESLRRGRGDCEDYAIAKLQLLRAAGFDPRDLYLVIVKDLVRRSDHAVLTVASGGRLLVLDNGTDRISDAADIADYRPVFTYAASGRWTHGYRRSNEPPVVLASATTMDRALPVPAAAPASNEPTEVRFTVTAADFAASLLG